MKKTFIVVIAVLFLFPVMLTAMTYYQTGGYRFNCDVKNDSFKDIRDVRVSGYVSSNSARLDFRADGYQQAYQTVYLRENQKDYRVSVRMRDPYVNYEVYDNSNKVVPGTYVNDSQFMYWGDEYGAKFTVPKKGFDQLQKSDIQVKVNYFTPFLARVYLRSLGDSWDIEVVIKRRDIKQSFNTIKLYLKRDGERENIVELRKPETVEGKLELLRTLTQDPLSVSSDDAYPQQIKILKEEIENSVLSGNKTEENINLIENNYPIFKQLLNKLKIRTFLTK
ncbi:hypothetical protein KAJ27_18100 [bacterium]|nr:hypothetical protein [bacterium]